MLKPFWEKRLPLKIRRKILEGGLSKWKTFNKAKIENDENYLLLYEMETGRSPVYARSNTRFLCSVQL